MRLIRNSLSILLVLATTTALPPLARGESTPPPSSEEKSEKEAEAEVESIRTRYWARGEESEMGVVQNRTFSKGKRLEVGVFGGSLSTDPFLSVQTVGVRVGYHLNETFAFHLLGWHDFVSDSTALETFKDTLGATTNNNPPINYLGAESTASLVYGKLSLLGKKILYYDMHALVGAGVTATQSGNYLTPHLGLGQQIFLSQSLSLRVDYRAQFYRETIIEKVITPRLGEVVGERNNWSHSVSLGISYYFGGNSE